MICRAQGCHGEAIVGHDFCGYHDELNEEGAHIRLKDQAVRPKNRQDAALRPAASQPRCEYLTWRGSGLRQRCLHYAAFGSIYCGIHRKIVKAAS